MTFGERVRAQREERGWSQHELSRRSGVSNVKICRIEAGQRTITLDTAQKLAKALDFTGEEMLSLGSVE